MVLTKPIEWRVTARRSFGRNKARFMVFQLILLCILLVCSAFFSGSETALFALTRHERAQLIRSRKGSARAVGDLMRRPRKLLLTLMVANVTINTFIFATSIAVFEQITGEGSALAPILGLIAPLTVTLFGELLPKGTAIELRVVIAEKVARIVQVIQFVLTPISFVLNTLFVEPMTRLLVGPGPPADQVTTDDLRDLVELSGRHQIIDADENAMLSEVIRLSEMKVRDVMVPRVDVQALDVEEDAETFKAVFREYRFVRLPVYREHIDQVFGVVYAKEFLLNGERSPAEMVHPIRFVPELISLTQLLSLFRETHSQIAAVVDEYGGMVGLVTIEDVAEQIVGELALPADPQQQPTWEHLPDGGYRVYGGVNIHDWSQYFGEIQFEESVTTLAGLMLARLGRLAEIGDEIHLGNLRLSVESLRGRRIEWIQVHLIDPPRPEERSKHLSGPTVGDEGGDSAQSPDGGGA